MTSRIANRFGGACIAATALTASTARADGTHFYALLVSSSDVQGSADKGANISIDTTALGSETCADFVNHEFWYGTYPGGANWVEVGFKDGTTNAGNCVHRVDFWADRRPDGSYNEHYPNNAWSLNTWYSAEVTNAGSCTWAVWLGGLQIGTSTSNCPGSGRDLNAGIENDQVGSEFDRASGFLANWNAEGAAGLWFGGWTGQALSTGHAPGIEWTSSSDTETEEAMSL